MKEKISILAIIVNALLTAGKIFVGVISGSALILSEGLHSLSDVFASAIGYAGIKIAQKPEDKKHPYGHFKFEVLLGLIITFIIFVAGLSAIYEAYKGFIAPEKIKFSILTFGVMLVAAAVNEIMARLKINLGKKESSMALLSDGMHSRIDVWASLGVVVGLVIARYWLYADALFAFLIGIYIIKESFSLGKEAVDSLLDVSAGEEIENKIKSIAQAQRIMVDNLKTQKKGAVVTANLEINLPDNLKVEEATKISENLRQKLLSEIENLQYVAIQIKSHDLETDFYRPAFGLGLGRGFGWERQGKFKDKIEEAVGQGPGGYCVCSKCGYKIPHQRGIPCSTLQCPNCKVNLERK
jgi:cation diffusion facilitator family transporter